MKLGFIDGSCERPSINSSTQNQWIRCDSIVVSWILNSIDPSLSGAFIYANSAKELCNELTERFRQSNGPFLYKVQKEVTKLYQGNDSVAVYYTKMKRLWDELADLSEILDCSSPDTCKAIKKTLELEQKQS